MAIFIDEQILFEKEEYDEIQRVVAIEVRNLLDQFQSQEKGGFAHLKLLKELVIGSGDTSFRADTRGIWLGAASFSDAPFKVGMDGVITASAITITGGTINGVVLTGLGAGSEISIQGWQSDLVFSASDADTVAWGSGNITLLDGTVYSISAGNTGNMSALTYIYLDIAVSTTVLQITTTPATAVGTGKILIAVAENNAGSDATFQVFGGSGGIIIKAANVAANSITANEIAANTITANEINVSTLSAISANLGSITAGSIDAVTITGSTITGTTLRTGTSGANVDLTAGRISQKNNAIEILYSDIGTYGGFWGIKDSAGNSIAYWEVRNTGADLNFIVNVGDLYIQVADDVIFVGTSGRDIFPASNNAMRLGLDSNKWADIQTTLINGADYGFEHNWYLTENYKVGIKEEGIAVLNPQNKLMMFIGEAGLYVKGGNVKNLDLLPYTKTTIKERCQMDRYPEKRHREKGKKSLKIPNPMKSKAGGVKYIKKEILLKKNIIVKKLK